MFENTTTVQLRSGTLDEALHILRTCIVPVIRSHNGLLGLGLACDYAQDCITIHTMWASVECAQRIERLCVYQDEVRKLDVLLADCFSSEKAASLGGGMQVISHYSTPENPPIGMN
jgi:hypothetical protein